MENLRVGRRWRPLGSTIPPDPGLDPNSAQLLDLLSHIADVHTRGHELIASVSAAELVGQAGSRRCGRKAELVVFCNAMREFNKHPNKHIGWLQHHARTINAAETVCVPLTYQHWFRSMVDNLAELARRLEPGRAGSTADTVVWAQRPCCSEDGVDSFVMRLRKCLSLFEQYTRLKNFE